MKTVAKRSLGLALAFLMCLSMIFSVNLTAYATNVDYVYSGKYIKNWGVREVVATYLSQNAIAFYTENKTSYAELTELSGSSTESQVPSSALYKKLQLLMQTNHSNITSYAGTNDLYQYTDCQNSGKTSSKISSFYSGQSVGPAWESGGKTWNKEHVWPNSKGDLAGSGENDIMMLRPTASSENSSRGNAAYGTATSTGYFNPNQFANGNYDLRGDVARIILYQYVRWGCTNTGSKYNPNGIFGEKGVIQSKEILLEWIEEDPVDTWELGRNDSVESITGTRNVFVDYPELAFDLFDEKIPKDMKTPSGYYSNGNNSDNNGGNSGGNTGGNTTVTPSAPSFVTVDTPSANTAYKFGVLHGGLGKTLYINGEMANTYYFGTVEDASSAIDVYLETAAGGYNLSTTVGGSKKYINIVTNGQYTNAKYEDTASTVYTLNTTDKMLVTSVNGTDYTLGSYGTYATVSPVKTSFTDDYRCWFYKKNETTNNFTDVSDNEWYCDAIDYVSGAGLMTGYGGSDKFGVSDNIQRQDFVVILARMAGVDLSQYDNAENQFADVPSGEYYANAILWAADAGITSGYAHTNYTVFGVGDPITREQLVTFLYRYAAYANGGVAPTVSANAATDAAKYADFASVSDFAKDAVIWALDKGVIKGQGGTHIAPANNSLRCEVAQIMYNISVNNLF